MSEDEENAYSKSFITSMHKNDFEKDLNNDLEKKNLNEDQLNYYLQAAKKLGRNDLIKIIEHRIKQFNEQITVRRSPSRSRSRSPSRRRRSSRRRSSRRRSSRSHSGSPTTARAPRYGGRSIHKRRTAKNKHRGGGSSLRNSVSNRNGEAYTVSKNLTQTTKHTKKLKRVKKSSNESLSEYIKRLQQHNVGKPGTIIYSFKRTAEKTVVPAYNKVVNLMGKKAI